MITTEENEWGDTSSITEGWGDGSNYSNSGGWGDNIIQDEENEILTGNATFKDLHVSKAENQQRSLDNHLTPLTKNLVDNIQNPVNLVEEVNDDFEDIE